jgi:predicted nucleic acid-binding protein
VPTAFEYPRDPDDAPYINLAIATGANLIVSRDRDLLDLMQPGSADGTRLRADHPTFRVLTPPQLLQQVEDAR